jgi:hypothetical protein
MYGGFLRIAFTGATGSGLGIVALRQGSLVGADTGGVTYSGTYTENQDARTLEFVITMTIPAGATPVQTGIPLATSMSVPLTASVLLADIGTDKPTFVQTPLGPVNALFVRISDFP